MKRKTKYRLLSMILTILSIALATLLLMFDKEKLSFIIIIPVLAASYFFKKTQDEQ